MNHRFEEKLYITNNAQLREKQSLLVTLSEDKNEKQYFIKITKNSKALDCAF